MPMRGLMPRNAGRIIEKPKGSSLGRLDRAVVADLLHRHLALLDLFDAGAGDPLDVAVAHLAFEQALGVADAVETEMADIGLGGDESHWNLIADLAAAQFRLENEGEFVGRPEARGALRRADHDRAGILTEGLELARRLLGVIDMADRGGETVGPETLDLVEREFRPRRDDQIIVPQLRAVRRLERVLLRHSWSPGSP